MSVILLGFLKEFTDKSPSCCDAPRAFHQSLWHQNISTPWWRECIVSCLHRIEGGGIYCTMHMGFFNTIINSKYFMMNSTHDTFICVHNYFIFSNCVKPSSYQLSFTIVTGSKKTSSILDTRIKRLKTKKKRRTRQRTQHTFSMCIDSCFLDKSLRYFLLRFTMDVVLKKDANGLATIFQKNYCIWVSFASMTSPAFDHPLLLTFTCAIVAFYPMVIVLAGKVSTPRWYSWVPDACGCLLT